MQATENQRKTGMRKALQVYACVYYKIKKIINIPLEITSNFTNFPSAKGKKFASSEHCNHKNCVCVSRPTDYLNGNSDEK
jgi:hypothetical protein